MKQTRTRGRRGTASSGALPTTTTIAGLGHHAMSQEYGLIHGTSSQYSSAPKWKRSEGQAINWDMHTGVAMVQVMTWVV